MNDELILETIVSTPDGSGLATKGKELEQKWNVNTERIKNNIDAIWAALAECVTSGNIVAIRINPITNKAEYTFDPVDGTEEWRLLTTEWSDITGDPLASTRLAAILNEKATKTEVSDLETTVTALSNTVEANTAELSLDAEKLIDHENRIANSERVEAEMGLILANKVDIKPGEYMMLCLNPDTNNVDFSLDGGLSWKPIMSSIVWSDLVGLPSSNIEFVTYMHDLVGFMIDDADFESISFTVQDWLTQLQTAINEELARKVNQDAFDNHINDDNNPHNVTKAQVGLSEVENLSPYDMPISNATQAAIDAIAAKDITFSTITGFEVTNRLNYDNKKAAGDLDTSAIYFVSRHNEEAPHGLVYVNETVTLNNHGTGYEDGDIVTLALDNQSLYLQIHQLAGGIELVVIQQGRSQHDFAGIDIPVEGGNGTGLTVDITTMQIEEG